MQRHQRVVDQALKKLVRQIDVESADHRALEIDEKAESRPPGEIEHHPRQRFVERHVSVAVTTQSFFVAQRLRQRLPDRNANVFDRMMRIDMQIAVGAHLKVDQSMAGDLVEHMIEKRNAGRKLSLTGTVKIQTNRNLGFERISGNFGLPHEGTIA